ncbi:hypothetical protein J4734_17240 [Klebsiella pneumoniae]|uniref:Uncharacterized protein n=1 Tax=Klebsiella pneumoniae TaxID=573 RepID=A0A939SW53_KLEPN|nr:hypothetical protein [Klebsiella pneumoniae]
MVEGGRFARQQAGDRAGGRPPIDALDDSVWRSPAWRPVPSASRNSTARAVANCILLNR